MTFYKKDYYPFGMLLPNRHASSTAYRYGFNGKEKDDELKGEGNSYDYGFRMYDPRIGRFFSTDPLTSKYPELTPYQFASNTPIQAIDLDGLERFDVISYNKDTRSITIKIVKDVFISKDISVEAYRNLDPACFAEIFESGNRKIFVWDIPKNGEQPIFMDEGDFYCGLGYEINIVYDVNLQYVDDASIIDSKNVANSVMGVGEPADFAKFKEGNNVIAFATLENAFEIKVNPDNYLNSPDVNPAYKESQATYEEITAHELWHNMTGLGHPTDSDGYGIYPKDKTLASNVRGKARPSEDDTKNILTKGLKRDSLNDDSNLLPQQ